MSQITENMLTAYADGEASPSERAAVEQALERDRDLQQALARYRALKAEITRSFSGALAAPIPPRLLQPILEEDDRTHSDARARRLNPAWLMPATMAASLMVGVSLGVFLKRGADDYRANVALSTSAPLADALSTLADGERRDDLLIFASYSASDETVCREFELAENRKAIAGLACAIRNGDWRLVAMKPVPPDNAYLPVGEETGSSHFPAITMEMRELATEDREAFFSTRRKGR